MGWALVHHSTRQRQRAEDAESKLSAETERFEPRSLKIYVCISCCTRRIIAVRQLPLLGGVVFGADNPPGRFIEVLEQYSYCRRGAARVDRCPDWRQRSS